MPVRVPVAADDRADGRVEARRQRACSREQHVLVVGVARAPVGVAETQLHLEPEIMGLRVRLLSLECPGPLFRAPLRLRVAREVVQVPVGAREESLRPRDLVGVGNRVPASVCASRLRRRHRGQVRGSRRHLLVRELDHMRGSSIVERARGPRCEGANQGCGCKRYAQETHRHSSNQTSCGRISRKTPGVRSLARVAEPQLSGS